ncbi:hypothetical protein CEXT_106801 [Caerostris extrusa]|uniref:Uncharacterized protein n=1 Tax=Caerostris extrusa TaxID=172846 RepID=A0AAV4SQ95_CAEEX|nr:hypothetical protein CEXT_106801 [Caerostris extrusa]
MTQIALEKSKGRNSEIAPIYYQKEPANGNASSKCMKLPTLRKILFFVNFRFNRLNPCKAAAPVSEVNLYSIFAKIMYCKNEAFSQVLVSYFKKQKKLKSYYERFSVSRFLIETIKGL